MTDTDANVPIEALLAHSAWVRRLAERLVYDAGRVDDVVQATWLAALEAPPRASGRLRSWLGRVLENQARQLGRREARRSRHEERAARTEAMPSTADLVEEADLQRRVVSCVLALQEPYRTTLLLRFYRGHSPSEIASLQDLPAGTVRSRIHRGLEQLRAELDGRFEGGRTDWCSALVLLAAPNRATWKLGAAGAGTGGLIMASKVAVGATLAAALGIGVWFTTRQGVAPEELVAAPPVSDTAVVELAPAAAPALELEREAVVAESGEPRVAVEAPATVAGEFFHGTVRSLAGPPIEGARLRFFENVNWNERDPFVEGTTDAEGRFHVDASDRPDNTLVAIEADGFQSMSTNPVTPEDAIDIQLRPYGSIFGEVRDAETGEPLADVALIHGEEVRTDNQGRYRLETVPIGQQAPVVVRKAGYVHVEPRVLIQGPEENRFDIELERGTPLFVTVVDRESGEPVEGASVQSTFQPYVTTGKDGVFQLQVAPGAEFYLTVEADGYMALTWILEPTEVPENLYPRLPLGRPAWIEGRVTDEAGAPLAKVGAYATNETRGRGELPKKLLEESGLIGSVRDDRMKVGGGRSGEDGTFRIPVAPAEEPYELRVVGGERVSRTLGPYLLETSDDRVSVDVVLSAGATIRGRVSYNGEEWSGSVVLKGPDGKTAGRATVADGSYELVGVEPGDVTLSLYTYRPMPLPDPVVLTVEAGKSYEHDFVWTEELQPITGRLTRKSGAPVSRMLVRASNTETRRGDAAYTDEDGHYQLDVPAGLIVDVSVRGEGWKDAQEGVLAGSTGVDFVMPDTGRLAVRLIDAVTREAVRPERSSHWGVSFKQPQDEAYRRADVDLDVNGSFVLELPVGEVDLCIQMCEVGYVTKLVNGLPVVADSERPHTIELEPGTELVLDLAGHDPPPAGRRLFFAFGESQRDWVRGPFARQGGESNHRINGVNVWVKSAAVIDQLFYFQDGRAVIKGLPPGTCYLLSFPDDIVFSPGEIELAGGERTTVEVSWEQR